VTIRRRLRSWWCVLLHGRHEFYLQRDRTHLYQECIVCGHQSHGWEIAPPKGKP
jgi:hypothetical protein